MVPRWLASPRARRPSNLVDKPADGVAVRHQRVRLSARPTADVPVRSANTSSANGGLRPSPPRWPPSPRHRRTSACPLAPARRVSAHQASAGGRTAAGHHAPVVEREIPDEQHAHHRHQADRSFPPSQPARSLSCQPSSPAFQPRPIPIPIAISLHLPGHQDLVTTSATACSVSMAHRRRAADVAFDQPAQDRHEPAEHDLQAPQVERQAGAVCNSAPLRLRR